jgi:hypothetical protein
MTEQQIDQCLETKELKLSAWGKFEHYSIVGFLFFIPIVIIFFYIKDILGGNMSGFGGGIFLFLIVPSVLGILFYRLQRNRLKFKSVDTNLTRNELNNIINQVSLELKWTIITNNERIIEAKTFPSFFSGSWGEQITILFDNKRLLVNSICDPDKQSSVVSMGRNNKNINKLIDEIKKASH